MNARRAVPLCIGLLLPSILAAQDLRFFELFAIFTNRQAALNELVPGTDDFFFFRALHAQNENRPDEVRKILDDWIRARKGAEPARARELRHRQALLDYQRDPQASLEYLKRELDLTFSHSRRASQQQVDLPSRLDTTLVSGQRFLQAALKGRADLSGISDAGLYEVALLPLTASQRRDLLRRVQRPDVPNLVSLIAQDLATPDSPPFGQLPIHRHLTLEQLDELLRLHPQLRNEKAFVSAYLARLLPDSETDLEIDTAKREAYLDRLWAYVQTLDPVHNSLKANVLYHRLVHDLQVGHPNRQRFLEYLKIPRDVPYLPQPLRQSLAHPQHIAQLEASFADLLLPAIRVEEPIVRQYLLWLLRDAPNYDEFRPWLQDDFLRRVFAETKIVHGIGDPEQWAALISPAEFRAIKERVDLEFAPDNPPVFLPDQLVRLKMFVKNVSTLIVRIYEINTLNYYRDTGQPLNLAINLDGLAPSFPEKKFEFREPKDLRMERSFEFPELKGRGVWVIDFIGEGRNSRAFVQKGRFEVLQDLSAAGHVFRVLDEERRLVRNARGWIEGREIEADAEGRLLVPFRPDHDRNATMVVHAGGFASLVRFQHLAESYHLDARPLIVAESLRPGGTATIAVRPLLTLHGQPVNPSSLSLEETVLTVTVTDSRNIRTEHKFRSPELTLDRELRVEIPLPRYPRMLNVSLSTRVRPMSPGEPIHLSSSREFSIAPLLGTLATRQVLLTLTPQGYIAELLGLNGEPIPGAILHCRFRHPWTQVPISVTLRTDEHGRAQLGALKDISDLSISLTATPPPDLDSRSEQDWRDLLAQQPNTFTWTLPRDRSWWPSALHGPAGQPLRLPLEQMENPALLSDFSLLEVRHGHFIRNCSSALSITNGWLELRGLEPGDYSLYVRSRQLDIPVRVTQGDPVGRYLLSSRRVLETPPLEPLQLLPELGDAENLVFRLNATTPHIRIHIAAGRYILDDTFSLAAGDVWPGLRHRTWTESRTFYESGRQLGDEFRYVLDRRGAPTYIGNMADRPSLLLNPWALRTTTIEAEKLQEGRQFLGRQAAGAFAGAAAARRAAADAGQPTGGTTSELAPSPWALDFLARPAVLLLNLRPDADGRIRIPRQQLEGCSFLRVLALDPCHAVERILPLDDPPLRTSSRTLARSLDPATPHGEHLDLRPLFPAQPHEVGTDAVVAAADSIPKVFSFYAALTKNSVLSEFEFLCRWPSFTPEQKNEFYSRYACHELHVFLYHKDRAFFDAVIAPYLANKRHKTFIDDWLLGRDLTPWLSPPRYAALNAAEKAMLARRLPHHQDAIARDLADLAAQHPRARTEMYWRFLFLAGDLPPTPFSDAPVPEGGAAILDRNAQAGQEFATAATLPPAAPAARTAMKAATTAASDELRAGGAEAARELESHRPSELPDARQRRIASLHDKKTDAPVDAFLLEDVSADRKAARPFFRSPDMPQELAEQNYYRQPISADNATLVPAGRFWADYAAHADGRPFLSTDFLFTTTNATEMLLVLSLLDLPFQASPLIREKKDGRTTVRCDQPVILLIREIRPNPVAPGPSPLLVAQNFFRADHPWRYEGDERVERYVSGPFLVGVPYGARVILTNPSAQRRFVTVLLQVPAGAVPLGPLPVEPVPRALEPYQTTTIEYFFYFPSPGEFEHYPATVSSDGAVLARAHPSRFTVIAEAPPPDETAWIEISQNGTLDQLCMFLERENLYRVRLADIAWRLREPAAYRRILDILERRRIFDLTLWSYSILHNDPPRIAQFLARHPFADQCGLWLHSPLLNIDPIERRRYQHLEYAPLINSRAHPLGREPRIQNPAFRDQYRRFLEILTYKPRPDDEDLLATASYLALQDRIFDSVSVLQRVDRARIAERMQYDYLVAWLSLCRGQLDEARRALSDYIDHPIPRWRTRIQTLLAHIREADGIAPNTALDPQNRDLLHQQLAAEQPSLELNLIGRQIEVTARHLRTVTINFYPMDLELLFSRSPFMAQDTRHFSHVRPAHSLSIQLPDDGSPKRVDIPEPLRSLDMMVEATAGVLRQTQAYYANVLRLHLIEPYGQLLLTRADTPSPVAGAYVKVYARLADGTVKFFKDGYTDLRGRFDYASIQDPSLATARRFSILIVSQSHGALVREASPPTAPSSER